MDKSGKVICAVLLCVIWVVVMLCGCGNHIPAETSSSSMDEIAEPCIEDGIVHLSDGGAYIYSRYQTASERLEAEHLFETNTTYIYIHNKGNSPATVELNFEDPRPLAPFVMNIAPGEVKYFNNLVQGRYYRLYFSQDIDGEIQIEITD